MPSGNKNLFKHKETTRFLKENDICAFIETGCTDKPPKIFNKKFIVAQNNMAEKQ